VNLRSRSRTRRILAGSPAWLSRAAVLFFAGLPVAVFFWRGVAGLFGAAQWSQVFDSGLAARSVGLAAAAAVVGVAVGTPAGLVAARLRRLGAPTAFFVFLAPLALPGAIHAYIWRNLALEAGLLGLLFVEGGGRFVNFSGAVLSLVGAYWTVPALAAFAVARGSGRRFEMEARVFAPAGTAARRILLPMMKPAALAAGGLVFILAFSDYGTAAAWQIRTFPEHVISLYSSFHDLSAAAAAGLAPAAAALVLAAVLYAAVRRTLSRLDVERAPPDAACLWRPSRRLKAGLAAVLLVLVGVPAGASAYYVWDGGVELAVVAPVFNDLAWTALVAAGSAVCASIVAVVAAAAHWTAGRAWRTALVCTASAAFVIPGAGFGLAAVAVSRWGLVPQGFSAGSTGLVWALAGRFMAVPLVMTTVFFGMLDERLANMQRLSGRRGWRETFTVTLPPALPAAAAGCAAASVLGVGELAIASLMAPPGAQPVSVHLFNLMHYAHTGEAFAAGLVMMAGGAAAVFVVLVATGGLWKRYLPAA